LYTHIDDFVESLRVVTPRGIIQSRKLPASGAGPSTGMKYIRISSVITIFIDRIFIGSEGIFGVITEAWIRLQVRIPRNHKLFSYVFL
jgi:alkyldihydroxyacetonephosphate synthase